MKRLIILPLVLLPLGISCASQTPLPSHEDQTLAVEQFIGKHIRNGKRGVIIRGEKRRLALEPHLDAELTGKVIFWTSFYIGDSSIELPRGFVLEKGRVANAKSEDISSIYKYLDDLGQVEESP